MDDVREIIYALDHPVVELIVVMESDGNSIEHRYPVSPRKNPWQEGVAYKVVAALARDGAPTGSGAVPAFGGAPARRIASATVRLKNGRCLDALDVLLEDGWRCWMDVERHVRVHPTQHSWPVRDARIHTNDVRRAIDDEDSPEYQAADDAYEVARVAEDALWAQVAKTWRHPVKEPEPVAPEPVALDPVAAPEHAVADPVLAAPVPANDTHAHDHATLLRRARSARDAAEAEERQALEAFLAAQEARRHAQADLDEIQATAELYSAPAVADGGEDWDPRLGPDEEEEAAEAEAHREFVATLNHLEADDRLTDALSATDAAEARLWSAVSRVEAVAGAGVVAEIGAACRVLWSAHQVERVASDLYDRAQDGRESFAA